MTSKPRVRRSKGITRPRLKVEYSNFYLRWSGMICTESPCILLHPQAAKSHCYNAHVTKWGAKCPGMTNGLAGIAMIPTYSLSGVTVNIAASQIKCGSSGSILYRIWLCTLEPSVPQWDRDGKSILSSNVLNRDSVQSWIPIYNLQHTDVL